jgi:hypothetical protein
MKLRTDLIQGMRAANQFRLLCLLLSCLHITDSIVGDGVSPKRRIYMGTEREQATEDNSLTKRGKSKCCLEKLHFDEFRYFFDGLILYILVIA